MHRHQGINVLALSFRFKWLLGFIIFFVCVLVKKKDETKLKKKMLKKIAPELTKEQFVTYIYLSFNHKFALITYQSEKKHVTS